jgi:hypothetical protein
MLSFNSQKDNASLNQPERTANAEGFPVFQFLLRAKTLFRSKGTPSQIIKQEKKKNIWTEEWADDSPHGSSCTRERKKTKQGTRNSNKNNRLNSKPRKETEDKHSLYGK